MRNIILRPNIYYTVHIYTLKIKIIDYAEIPKTSVNPSTMCEKQIFIVEAKAGFCSQCFISQFQNPWILKLLEGMYL